MAEIVDTLTNPDHSVWVCKKHGIIDEGSLAEGVDWSRGTSPVDGDVCWTGRFYCQFDHEDGDDHEALLVDLKADIERALASDDQEARDA